MRLGEDTSVETDDEDALATGSAPRPRQLYVSGDGDGEEVELFADSSRPSRLSRGIPRRSVWQDSGVAMASATKAPNAWQRTSELAQGRKCRKCRY